ncbi:hypothetical protein CY34DRAFT_801817 [Suillus luteus UH-Slu-Lm8-n1]|uniref:Uncharacterized protein n=1 Tax=Suillus luteus UH-Slu-Lm8-n1 TaxID=930992 RepID=A0A0D0AU31_9AGAM|nr:hypothetical protein CY34DRAFT_801817 [Suillus luteus UH-Slu-Lm8-n1]
MTATSLRFATTTPTLSDVLENVWSSILPLAFHASASSSLRFPWVYSYLQKLANSLWLTSLVIDYLAEPCKARSKPPPWA